MSQRRALAIVLGVVLLVWRLGPTTTLAAAPDVREVTPAGITIDGSAVDWDEPEADFLANMFEAGRPDKDVLSRLYGRYDCSTETFYVFVQTVTGWSILPSDNDNYVKLGQTDILVNGSSGHDGTPPDFAYVGAKAWEAAFHLAPGSYLGDNGLNVHAQVIPDARPATSAVADRRLAVTIDCSTLPTAPPTTAPTAPPTTAPTAPPTAPPSTPPSVPPSTPPSVPPSTPPSVPPSTPPSVPPSIPPTAPPTTAPTAPPTAPPTTAPTAAPSGSVEPTSAPSAAPPVDPPIIVPKVNDQGTPETSDDRIVPGAVFEFRLDDGDGTYEPVGDDAPVLAEVDAVNGFAVFTPSEAGDYWVTESTAPPGLEIADPVLAHYTASPENCGLSNSVLRCVPDDDQSGGFLIVVVMDSPIGGVGGEEITPPPTDVAPEEVRRPVDIVLAAMVILLGAAVVLGEARNRQSR